MHFAMNVRVNRFSRFIWNRG